MWVEVADAAGTQGEGGGGWGEVTLCIILKENVW